MPALNQNSLIVHACKLVVGIPRKLDMPEWNRVGSAFTLLISPLKLDISFEGGRDLNNLLLIESRAGEPYWLLCVAKVNVNVLT